MDNFVAMGLLLFVACLVAIVTRRIGFPYAVGLVLAIIGLTFAGGPKRTISERGREAIIGF